MSTVCILAPDHAEALEERGVVPDCDFHRHLSHGQADKALNRQRDETNRLTIEGWGSHRTVMARDGRRRITPIASILGYASRGSGFGGPQTLQAIMAELH